MVLLSWHIHMDTLRHIKPHLDGRWRIQQTTSMLCGYTLRGVKFDKFESAAYPWSMLTWLFGQDLTSHNNIYNISPLFSLDLNISFSKYPEKSVNLRLASSRLTCFFFICFSSNSLPYLVSGARWVSQSGIWKNVGLRKHFISPPLRIDTFHDSPGI